MSETVLMKPGMVTYRTKEAFVAVVMGFLSEQQWKIKWTAKKHEDLTCSFEFKVTQKVAVSGRFAGDIFGWEGERALLRTNVQNLLFELCQRFAFEEKLPVQFHDDLLGVLKPHCEFDGIDIEPESLETFLKRDMAKGFKSYFAFHDESADIKFNIPKITPQDPFAWDDEYND